MARWARLAAVAALVVCLDQASKALAIASLERGEKTSVFFGIDLTNARNSGVAFGLFEGGGAVIYLLGAAIVALLLAFFALRGRTRPLLWLPVGALVGGAAGNLIDRARLGEVIDFIDPVVWPAFNLADTAIVVGVFGLLYVMEGAPESPEQAGA